MTAATLIHDLQQGGTDWHAFRAQHFGASEAAAMLGLSKLMTRSELLKLKSSGIGKERSQYVQERILDRGHEIETAIRPHMESVIGEDLYAVTCSKPGTKLSASCDGLTLAGDTAWENKQFNADLAEAVSAGRVPDEHMPQCQQILMVTAAQRVVFSVSDGTPNGTVYTEVRPDPAWFDRIARGWAQFEADLQGYVAPETAPTVTPTPTEHLPAVSVQMQGALSVISNLVPFGEALRAFVARIPKAPSTDQEFADTEAACKRLKTAEEALDHAEAGALASISDVEAMRRAVADLRELARATRLASEKVVKQRKEQIRETEVARGGRALVEHVRALNARIGVGTNYLPLPTADFASAIKGLKTLDSVRNAIDTLLARAKIDANATAERIVANLATINGAGPARMALFADRAQLVLKDPEAVAAIVAQRIAEADAAEARRLEVIRAEERARAEREAADRARREQQESEAARARAEAPQPESTPAAPMGTAVTPGAGTAEAAPSAPPTLRLGAICDRLGFTLTSQFMASLGFPAAGTAGAAKLYHDHQWAQIKAALIRHIEACSP